MSLLTYTLLSVVMTFVLALAWFAIANTDIKNTALVLACAGTGSLYASVYDEAIAHGLGAVFGLAGAVLAKFFAAALAGRLMLMMKKKGATGSTRGIR